MLLYGLHAAAMAACNRQLCRFRFTMLVSRHTYCVFLTQLDYQSRVRRPLRWQGILTQWQAIPLDASRLWQSISPLSREDIQYAWPSSPWFYRRVSCCRTRGRRLSLVEQQHVPGRKATTLHWPSLVAGLPNWHHLSLERQFPLPLQHLSDTPGRCKLGPGSHSGLHTSGHAHT